MPNDAGHETWLDRVKAWAGDADFLLGVFFILSIAAVIFGAGFVMGAMAL